MESLLFLLESLLLWWIARAGDAPQRPAELFATGALIALIAEGRATAALLLLPAAIFLLPWRATPRAAHEVPPALPRSPALRPARASAAPAALASPQAPKSPAPPRRPRLAPAPLASAAAALAAGFALIALPVAARTWVVTREWIPFTYNFGFNLYAGNNPQATGGFTSITQTQLISPVGPIHEDGAAPSPGASTSASTSSASASHRFWSESARRTTVPWSTSASSRLRSASPADVRTSSAHNGRGLASLAAATRSSCARTRSASSAPRRR